MDTPSDQASRPVLTTPPADIYVAHTGSPKGRGVFAARPFAQNEVVETAPIVLCHGSFADIPREIRELLFNWSALSGVRAGHGLALGCGSLYNHDNPANMRYEADAQRQLLCFIAARDIATGEELTINYNSTAGAPDSTQDTWFERHGIVVAGAE